MNNKPIAIFDSGIGGLTVLKEIIKNFPNENIIYLADNKNLPYGDKSDNEIIFLTKKILDFFKKKEVKLVIIACNTISAVAYEKLKNNYEFPILDIITPCCEYIIKNKHKNIGLIATNATVKNGIYESKIKNLKSVPCPLFVPMIEQNLENTFEFNKICTNYLDKFENKIENLILGCTHYHLIENNIKSYFNKKSINIINPTNYIIETIKNYLYKKNNNSNCVIYSTNLNENFKNNAFKILSNNYKIQNIIL